MGINYGGRSREAIAECKRSSTGDSLGQPVRTPLLQTKKNFPFKANTAAFF